MLSGKDLFVMFSLQQFADDVSRYDFLLVQGTLILNLKIQVCHQIRKGPSFLHYFSSLISFFLRLQYQTLCYYPTGLFEALSFFFPPNLFFFFCSSDRINSTDLSSGLLTLHCCFHSALEPTEYVFIIHIIFFISIISISYNLYAENFSFNFKCVSLYLLEHSYTRCLQVFHKFSIWVILTLPSVGYLFP